MDNRTPLVWNLDRVNSSEAAYRDSILDAFPGGPFGLNLDLLSKMMGTGKLELHVTGISKNPLPFSHSTTGIIPVALSQGASPDTSRAVLGLPMNLAGQIVSLTLGREKSFNGNSLSAGEQGALLYALDRAGGDWICGGGSSFTVRGFLNDIEQVEDYLGHDALMEIRGRIKGDELEDAIYLWFPEKIISKSKSAIIDDLPQNVGSWPVSVRLSIGLSLLHANDLKNLALGHFVLLDELSHPDSNHSHCFSLLSAGKWHRYSVWSDRQSLKIVSEEERSALMKTRTNANDPLHATLEKTQSNDSGSMDVKVQVELGELKMTVEQAAGLLPGRILNLERDVDTSVSLRVGQKLIANGELVNCDGSMAVEIKEIL